MQIRPTTGAIKNGMPPIHPGEILKETYLKAVKMSASAFAEHIGVTRSYISNVIAGRRDITVELALRLGKAFSTTPEFWLNLQLSHDIRVVETTKPNLTDNIEPLF